MQRRLTLAIVLITAVLASTMARADYTMIVTADKPVAWWRFDGDTSDTVRNHASADNAAALNGKVAGATLDQVGPRPKRFVDFSEDNKAARFGGNGAAITIPGNAPALKFAKGDSITIEAWVNASSIGNNQQVYIVGKGRTGSAGFAADNQNWALRLRGDGGVCEVSFLFRSEANRRGESNDWHRWNSHTGFAPGASASNEADWHHVAVTYTFGKADSVRGYIDGQVVEGSWDYGGPSNDAPVVDDDEVWIGSSMGRNPASSFVGAMDEIAIYRTALSAERIAAHYKIDPSFKPQPAPLLTAKDLSDGKLVVEIFEGIPDSRNWAFDVPTEPVETHVYDAGAFGFTGFPTKYNDKGLIIDRTGPFMVRATGKVHLPAGRYRVLLRSHNSARLFIDDKKIDETRFTPQSGGGHEAVPDSPVAEHPDLRPLPVGNSEKVAEVTLHGDEHVVRLEAIVGGKRLRPEVADLAIALAGLDKRELYRVISTDPSTSFALTDDGWARHAEREAQRLLRVNHDARLAAAAKEADYWSKRHEWARQQLKNAEVPPPPQVKTASSVSNAIDQFIVSRLEAASVEPAPLTDDAAFLRRIYLDTVGVIPTPREVEVFLNDKRPDKRTKLIDQLLDDPRWADHWVAYWQDVLAENPGVLKPKLNNTGPFRWYLYEAFLDNRSIDRFATDLILMEGSKMQGGPAGFGMASQNDVPMAAKAHIVGTAFLGVEMKCARCHDAPFHPFKQEQLFHVAAMLRRAPQEVPSSSSVPQASLDRKLLVTVSLKPGAKVEPQWPFDKLAEAEVPTMLTRDAKDQRERLAAIITSPENPRFAQVIANRLWKRYLGVGLVEPVDDWDSSKPSHPELITWLGHELATHDYDLKHLARLIFNSQTYQRQAVGDATTIPAPNKRLFAGPARRRMTAEQVIDSMFVAAGKSFHSEQMNMDLDGRSAIEDFLNLGTPTRAWQFASLSNERDRPALAMPVAQYLTDMLKTFGWRETRQDPLTVRDQTPSVLQPLAVANSVVGSRVVTLSDDHAMTETAIADARLDQIIETAFLRYLSRKPTSDEMTIFASLLSDGFDNRVNKAAAVGKARSKGNAVSWSNHLSAEATTIKMELERQAAAGDSPTERLNADWRQRMEDMLWALANSPEFLFVP